MDGSRARREIEKALAIQDDVDFADALMELIDCSEDELYARLPPPLKEAVALNAFSLETNSGGFYQLIANSEPALLDDIRAGLQRIGAVEASQVLDGIREGFPKGLVPDDQQKRLETLDQLDRGSVGNAFRKVDSDYAATGEDVLALLKAHVARQKDEMAAALAAWRT